MIIYSSSEPSNTSLSSLWGLIFSFSSQSSSSLLMILAFYCIFFSIFLPSFYPMAILALGFWNILFKLWSFCDSLWRALEVMTVMKQVDPTTRKPIMVPTLLTTILILYFFNCSSLCFFLTSFCPVCLGSNEASWMIFCLIFISSTSFINFAACFWRSLIISSRLVSLWADCTNGPWCFFVWLKTEWSI